MAKAIPGVMTDFRINELSGVTVPAQKGATVRLMKHDTQAQEQGTMKEIAKALGLPETATEAEIVAKLNENAQASAASAAALATATAKAGMTDAERAYVAEKKFDDPAIVAFMAKDAAVRKSEVEAFNKSDESVIVDGRTVRKSAVGEEAFSVMKSMQARQDVLDARVLKAEEAAETARLTKAADEDYPHVAGSTDDRVLALRHIAKADEKTRAAFDAILKAAEATAKMAFIKVGGSGNGGSDSVTVEKAKTDFLGKVNEIARANPSLSRSQAMSKAREEHPTLFEAYSTATSTSPTGN